jgi:rRNA biogenesis protein RRP5
MFESLLASNPRRFDLWVQLLDHEDVPGADKTLVRNVFERALRTTKGLRARTAKKWLKRWRDWEEENGDEKSREKVVARAAEWVKARKEEKEVESDNGDQ